MTPPGVPKGVPPIVAYWPIDRVRASAWDAIGRFIEQLGMKVDTEELLAPVQPHAQLRQVRISGTIADGSRFAVSYQWSMEHQMQAHLEMHMAACDRRRQYHDWSN